MKVLITRKIPRVVLDHLSKHTSLQIEMLEGEPLTEEQLIQKVQDVDALLTVIPDQITKTVINAAPNLKVISTYSVGYDHIDLKAATEKGIPVTNTPGDLTESVAEFTWALILAIAKKIVVSDKYVRSGCFKCWEPLLYMGPRINEKTLGLVGLGSIGCHVARMAKGFNMNVLYYDIKQNQKAELETGAKYVSLHDLLEKSDFVSIHVPLLPSTQHLIDLNALKKMKPTAYLVNTSRGPVIDEDALAKALEEKWIEGAALDVFEEEPHIYDKLMSLDNVILTPHIASATREARIQMARIAAENIIEVLINNKTPTNLVNRDLNA